MAPRPTFYLARRVVATYLFSREHRGNLYNLDDVANQLEIAADVAGNDAIRIDVNAFLRRSFADGSRGYEYTLPYDGLDLGFEEGISNILYAKKWRETYKSPWIVFVGCFGSLEEATNANVVRLNVGLDTIQQMQLVDELESRSSSTSSTQSSNTTTMEEALERIKQLEEELQSTNEKLQRIQNERSQPMEIDERGNNQTKRPTSAAGREQADGAKRSKQNEDVGTTTIRYLLDGRAGEVEIENENDATISLIDLKANIIRGHVRSDQLVAEKRASSYEVVRLNGVDIFVPKGVTALLTCHYSRICNESQKTRDLKGMFEKVQKSKWPPEIMRMFAGFSMQNSGGSDQATTMLVFAAFKAINMKLDLGLSNDQLANGTFCQTTLINAEFELAAHSYFILIDEMKLCKSYALSQDGGNKNGQECLAKVITYPVVVEGEDGKLSFRFGRFCLDIEASGKKAEEVADALANSIDGLERHIDAKCTAITGDAGGGGAVQTVFQYAKLKLKALQRFIRCLLHAYNKCLERALTASVGPPGIGKNGCLQMAFASINLLITVQKEGGLKLFDEYVDIVLEKIENDEEWQALAEEVLKQQYQEFKAFRNSELYDEIAATLRDLQKPVLTRWQTSLPGIKFVTRNSVLIYFMARVVAERADSGSYLHMCACDVIALIQLRAAPVVPALLDASHPLVNDTTATDAHDTTRQQPTTSLSHNATAHGHATRRASTRVNTLAEETTSHSADETTSTDGTSSEEETGFEDEARSAAATHTTSAPPPDESNALKPGESSQLMTQLLFIDGFANCVYGNFFTLACRPDERFGTDSQSHISGMCVERCHIMKTQVMALMEEDGLKNAGTFEQYLKALEGIPYLGKVERGGREYFAKMEKVFLEEFMASFRDHVESVWRSNEILPYILGGSPVLAKEFAKYLHYYYENSGAMDDDGDGNVAPYAWSTEIVELEGHDITGDTIKVEIAACMGYLFENADPYEILNDPLIEPYKDQLWQLAASNNIIDLFDTSTWGENEDFTPLRGMVHEEILIHCAHNQGVESMIYAAGTVTKTGVGEARASARILLQSFLIRRHNHRSIEAKKEKQTDEEAKKKVQRTKDKFRNVTFAETMDDANERIKKMEEQDEKYNDKVKEKEKELRGTNTKMSTVNNQKKLEAFKKAAAKPLTDCAAMTKKEGMQIPPAVGQMIVVSFLRKGVEGHVAVVYAEIAKRGITIEKEVLDKMKWDAVKDLLQEDELKILATKGLATHSNGKPMAVREVKSIDPQSDQLKALLPDQNEWNADKRNKK